MKNITQSLKLITLALVLSIGISYVSAWTAPTLTPPNGNVAAPINVGSTAQIKTGGLTVSNLAVGGTINSGAITAPKFCIGTSCITSWIIVPTARTVIVTTDSVWTVPADTITGTVKATIVGGGGGGAYTTGSKGNSYIPDVSAANPGDTFTVNIGQGGGKGFGATYGDCGSNGAYYFADTGIYGDNMGGRGGTSVASPGSKSPKGVGCMWSFSAYQGWGGGGGGSTKVVHNQTGISYVSGGGAGSMGQPGSHPSNQPGGAGGVGNGSANVGGINGIGGGGSAYVAGTAGGVIFEYQTL